MFDGNFRGSRREVNLASRNARRRGPNNNSTTVGKAALLQNADRQRRERQEKQRRDRAAKLIQRITRGWLTKLHVLKEFLPMTGNLSAVALCLSSLKPWLYKFSTTPKQLLLEVASVSANNNNNNNNNANHIETTTQQMDKSDSMETDDKGSDDLHKDSLWFSQSRIVQVCLQELTPQNTTSIEEERQALFSLLKQLWPCVRIQNNDDMFMILCHAFQLWWNELPSHEISQTLCTWTIQASSSASSSSTKNKNNNDDNSPNLRKALLASILLQGPNAANILQNLPNVYSTWLTPLASCLPTSSLCQPQQQQQEQNDNKNNNDALLQAIHGNVTGGKEQQILSNILQLPPPPKEKEDPQLVVLQFIHHTLSQETSQELTLAVSLLVRGDSIDTPAIDMNAALSANASNNTNSNNEWGDSDDESDDDEDEEMTTATNNNTGTPNNSMPKKQKSSSRLTRKEILTLVKLDKLYRDEIQQIKKRTIFSPDIQTLARQIIMQPQQQSQQQQQHQQNPWMTWGLQLLDDPMVAPLYIETLFILLQSTTSLRPNSKVGVLSPLAFSKAFLQKLWNHASSSSSTTTTTTNTLALVVFCDLFAHYLVALSDVDFQTFHTMSSSDNHHQATPPTSVLAQDVIEQLRGVLHELYWTKPVLVSEIDMRDARGRLLLAGTKVWNSLYERWNRLVRTPFCDEATWWFQPPLASQQGDGAVVPAREREDNDDSNHMMDIDEDDNRPMSSAEAETDALADIFRDPKMARILTSIPQALPFDRRVKLFSSLLKADKHKTMQAAASSRALMAMNRQSIMNDGNFFIDGSIRERVRIRRANLYTDSMHLLNELGPKLKHKVQVSFVNQHGAEEAGIDGGGVFKEFLDDLIKDGFAAKTTSGDGGSSDAGAPPLFSVTPLQTLAVNLDLAQDQSMLVHYEFLGRVLGKAVYESILVEPQFCLPFLNQLLAKTNTMEDLKNFDEEFYKNLNKLRTMSQEDLENMGLTFEVSVGGISGTSAAPRTVELFPGGRSKAVTKQNVFQYMHMVAHQLLNVQGARQTRAFLRGFRDLIPASWVRLFSANELQKLISGDDSVRGIDVVSLKKSMTYLGGYHPSQPYIVEFWDILEKDLTPEQQRKFLRFMTSCSRQPLLGFGSLEPPPSIQQIRLRDDELSRNSKLPTSQTCMNLLKLPNYKDRQLLKEKLIAAIESGAGFELT